jgi:hypothetical protein
MVYRPKISFRVQQQIRERAIYLCEYCHTSEQWQYVRFTADHIIPLSRGGADVFDNLCLACFHCNRRKGNHITGRDIFSGEEVPLFHPRKELWKNHFIWSADKLRIIGLSPTGRATAEVLELNRDRAVRIRAADMAVGRHPPTNDPVQMSEP